MYLKSFEVFHVLQTVKLVSEKTLHELDGSYIYKFQDACSINIGFFWDTKGISTFDALVCKNGGGCIFQNIYHYYKLDIP